ncbi:MAG TPA: DUF2490 domain-containing protein [Pyrinomonadaceae bacterium]
MKTIKVKWVLTGIFLCAIQAAAQVPEKDTQNWNDVQLTVPMTRKVDFVMQGTLRLGDNLTTAVDKRGGAGFNYKVNPWLTLSQSFFSRQARPPHGRRERETRLTLGATLQKPLGKFTLSDRQWLERRWRAPQVDAWRYRNRVRLEHPFEIDQTKFTGFISDEVFYDWSLHDWVRNRAAIGAYHAFNKHFTLELYYMRQNDGRSRPGDIHILGSVWRFKL